LVLGRPVLTRLADYDAVCRQFRWPAPAAYNIGVEVCDRWADFDSGRIALIDAHADYCALSKTTTRMLPI